MDGLSKLSDSVTNITERLDTFDEQIQEIGKASATPEPPKTPEDDQAPPPAAFLVPQVPHLGQDRVPHLRIRGAPHPRPDRDGRGRAQPRAGLGQGHGQPEAEAGVRQGFRGNR